MKVLVANNIGYYDEWAEEEEIVDWYTASYYYITTSKIEDNAVTEDKIADEVISSIAANTAKVGYTDDLVAANSAVAANTAKTGITSDQASAIDANTAKTGITSYQASSNHAKTAIPPSAGNWHYLCDRYLRSNYTPFYRLSFIGRYSIERLSTSTIESRYFQS